MHDQRSPSPVRGPVRLFDAAGTLHPLAELTGGGPAMVVFWSRFFGYALDAVPEVERLTKRLEQAGGACS